MYWSHSASSWHNMETWYLSAPSHIIRDIFKKLISRGIVRMNHRLVNMLWHIVTKSPTALQVNAKRQR